MKDFYPCNEDFNKILGLGFYDDIKRTDYHLFLKGEVCGIFNISMNELDVLIQKIERISKRDGFKKGFEKSFFEDEVSVLGMYLLCHYNEDSDNKLFEKYKPLFVEQGLRFAIKLIGNISSDRTENRNRFRGSMPGVDYEELIIMNSVKKISPELKQMKTDIEDTSHFFYQKKVVITGSFERFPFREDMAKLLHNVGADVNSGISRKTDYVIVGENAGPKKLEKIEELGIETIDEKRFLEIFNL